MCASTPASRDRLCAASVALPVTKTTGMCCPVAASLLRISRTASSPPISGISSSRITASNRWFSNRESAWMPFSTATTSCPCFSRSSLVICRLTGVSSASNRRSLLSDLGLGSVATGGTIAECASAAFSSAFGRRNQNRVPRSGRFSAPIVPPQRSTVILQK